MGHFTGNAVCVMRAIEVGQLDSEGELGGNLPLEDPAVATATVVACKSVERQIIHAIGASALGNFACGDELAVELCE